MIIHPTQPPRSPRSSRSFRKSQTRASWPLTPYGTLAAAAMLAGVVMVIFAVWVS